ncbi:hypothetical protein EI613_02490 [Azospirillum sp. 412522]|nr:hypothetical protein [Azospirillum sp. 412522]
MSVDFSTVIPWGAIPWLVLIAFYGLPLLHVAVSRRGGSWRPPVGSRCPFGPRAGWLVMVLMLGPVGWLMFALRRPRRASNR